MKNDQIIDAIGMINDEAVRDAKSYRCPQSRRWTRWGVIAACLAVILITVTTAVAAAMGTMTGCGSDSESGQGSGTAETNQTDTQDDAEETVDTAGGSDKDFRTF